MGYVLPSAGLTCEELLIDFEELLSGEALKLSLQQLTQQVNRLNQVQYEVKGVLLSEQMFSRIFFVLFANKLGF